MVDEDWTPPFIEASPIVNGVELWEDEGYLSPYVPTPEVRNR